MKRNFFNSQTFGLSPTDFLLKKNHKCFAKKASSGVTSNYRNKLSFGNWILFKIRWFLFSYPSDILINKKDTKFSTDYAWPAKVNILLINVLIISNNSKFLW